jgi:hypothetical protein
VESQLVEQHLVERQLVERQSRGMPISWNANLVERQLVDHQLVERQLVDCQITKFAVKISKNAPHINFCPNAAGLDQKNCKKRTKIDEKRTKTQTN